MACGSSAGSFSPASEPALPSPKLYSMGPMFRYERPQKGRYRQFHQIDVEALGFEGPDVDAELIMLSARLWKRLGLQHIRLELNSLGTQESRGRYRQVSLTMAGARVSSGRSTGSSEDPEELAALRLLPLLGLFVAVFGAYYVVKREAAFSLRRWWVAPVGLIGGTISAMLGVSGPIYVMYLAGRGATPDAIRATMPVLFIFTVIARVVLFSIAGLFTTDLLLAAVALAPVMFAGLYLGNRLHLNIPRDKAARLVGALLFVNGVSLLLRAW